MQLWPHLSCKSATTVTSTSFSNLTYYIDSPTSPPSTSLATTVTSTSFSSKPLISHCTSTSLVLSLRHNTFPINRLQTFHRKKISTLTSLSCSNNDNSDPVLIAYPFPYMQQFDLNDCRYIFEEGTSHVLRTCSNISHLNLTDCSRVKLPEINFIVSKWTCWICQVR